MTEHRVARYEYPSHFADIDGALLPQIRAVLQRGDYILGVAVDRFEAELASFVGSRYAVGVNSGTDALILSLTALGIGLGDEVITVANTFHATALAVARVGARPVLVDCRPDDYLIDLDQVQAAITARTRALVVVHLFGRAVEMSAVRELAQRHGLLVIEDAAQALGARSRGRRVGGLSAAGCFSFAPSKNLAAAGDAGAVTLDDPSVAEHLRVLRHFGQSEQNEHRLLGFNSRLDTIQALVLSHKLPYLESWTESRVRIATRYRELLAELPLGFQDPGTDGEHVYHLFHVCTPARNQLLAWLQARGIDAVVRYPHPIHLQPAFAGLGYSRGDFPVSERLAAETLCLPLHHAMSEAQVEEVCIAISDHFQTAARGTRATRGMASRPPDPLAL
jgi:dTDP-4-amino-4,6-dideoxygalactose transaminase